MRSHPSRKDKEVLWFSGTVVQSRYELAAGAPIPNGRYTAQPGDRIFWQQCSSGVVGRINLQFYDAQEQFVRQFAWHVLANDGAYANQSYVQGQWLNRSVALDAFTGLRPKNGDSSKRVMSLRFSHRRDGFSRIFDRHSLD